MPWSGPGAVPEVRYDWIPRASILLCQLDPVGHNFRPIVRCKPSCSHRRCHVWTGLLVDTKHETRGAVLKTCGICLCRKTFLTQQLTPGLRHHNGSLRAHFAHKGAYATLTRTQSCTRPQRQLTRHLFSKQSTAHSRFVTSAAVGQ